MMNILDLEKLSEQVRIAEKISAGFVDEQAYNVVTKVVNESAIMESEDEIKQFHRNSAYIDHNFDLEEMLKTVNAAFEGTNSTEKKMAQNKVFAPGEAELQVGAASKGAVSQKQYVDGKLRAPDAVANSWRKQSEEQKKFAKGDEKQTEVTLSNPSKTVEGKTPGATLKSATKGVTENAVEIKKPTVPKQDAPKAPKINGGPVEAPKSESNIKSKQAFAGDMKKDAFGGKKQNVPNTIIGGAAKFESFVTSLKTKENSALIEAVISAFRLTR